MAEQSQEKKDPQSAKSSDRPSAAVARLSKDDDPANDVFVIPKTKPTPEDAETAIERVLDNHPQHKVAERY